MTSSRRGGGTARGAILRVVAIATTVAVALLGLLAVQLDQSAATGRRGLEDRLGSRTALSRKFVGSYVDDLIDQVRTHAELSLAAANPTATEVADVSRALRFPAAVLVDGNGRVLQVVPANPAVIGQDLAPKFDHLRVAVAGQSAVSVVVPSAAQGAPIVAFAVPFSTPYGQRVYSAGLDLSSTPLGRFLQKSNTLPGQNVYLVDTNGKLVAGTTADITGTLADHDPALAAAAAAGPSGTFDDGGRDVYFTSEKIGSAPWRIVTSVPASALYQPLEGGRLTPWLLFATFALASLSSVVLVARVLHQRRGLERSNHDLELLTATLRASDEQVRRVIATAGDAFVAMNDLGQVTAWNDHAVSLFGHTTAAVMGRPLHELIIPAEHRDAHVAGIARFLASGEGTVLDRRIELEALHADGTRFPVELSIWALRNETGWDFNALIRDVSERHRQQKALRDSEQRLRITQDSAATGMARVSLDGRWLDVNPALCAIIGRTADELRGLRFHDVTHPDDLDPNLEDLHRLIAGETTHFEMERRYVRPDGTEIWVQIHVALSRRDDREPDELIVQVIDIDHRKRARDHDQAVAAVSAALVAAGVHPLDVADTITTRIAEFVGDQASLSLVDPAAVELRTVSVRGRNDEAAALALALAGIRPQRLDDPSMAAQAVQKQATVVIDVDDPGAYGRAMPTEYREYFARFPVHHLLHVPAMIGDRVLAVINVMRHRQGRFTAAEIALVEAIASRAAYAIDSARLFTEKAEAEHALIDAHAVLQATNGELRHTADEATRERDFSSVLLAAMHEGYLFIVDSEIHDVNDQFCALSGFTRDELIGQTRPYPFWAAADVDRFLHDSDQVRDAGAEDLEIDLARPNGDRVPVALAVRAVHNADGTIHGYVTTVTDLTEHRRRETELIAIAGRDPLTDLHNRRSIDEHFERLRAGDAVIVLDLDHFKTVNDTHGHAAGDHTLVTLARCIKDCLRGKDWAGRLGGEEFIIVVRDGQQDGADSVISRLRHHWDTTGPLTSFSAGIAVHALGTTPGQTLAHADHAMYQAKQNGRNRTETASLHP